MPYQVINGRIHTRSIEYSAAYHCNMRCFSCSHLSPFQNPYVPTIESFSRDLSRLQPVLHADVIRLLGGEPLLNPAINQFIGSAKRIGIADQVMVTTNGILLPRMGSGFWEHLDLLLISMYPDSKDKINLEYYGRLGLEKGVLVWGQAIDHFRTITLTEPQPLDWITRLIFRNCEQVHRHHCHMIHEGWLYKCPLPPFLPAYLAKLGIDDYDCRHDGVDLHHSGDLFGDLWRYLTEEEPLVACRYCLGDVGVIRPHRQLDRSWLANPKLADVTRERHLDQGKLKAAVFRFMANDNPTGHDQKGS